MAVLRGRLPFSVGPKQATFQQNRRKGGVIAYEIAKGSAMESGAIIDILHRLHFIELSEYRKIKVLLHRVISMLAKLCFNLAQRSGENGKRPRLRNTATD